MAHYHLPTQYIPPQYSVSHIHVFSHQQPPITIPTWPSAPAYLHLVRPFPHLPPLITKRLPRLLVSAAGPLWTNRWRHPGVPDEVASRYGVHDQQHRPRSLIPFFCCGVFHYSFVDCLTLRSGNMETEVLVGSLTKPSVDTTYRPSRNTQAAQG
jgi:hypothetical protein